MTPWGRAGEFPAPPWAYFLDIDGTLVAIARTPGSVRIERGLRTVIERLYRSAGGAVALITGRPISDVDRLFPGIRLPVAGQHGIERRGTSGRVTRHRFPASRLGPARMRLAEAARRHPGLLLEDKGLSLALHYRRAPRLGAYAHRLMRQLAGTLGPAYCVQAGKRVVEIRPTGRDKGTAIRDFMRERPFKGRTPLFLGDDATDEFGFAMVNRLGGHSIKVGPGATSARWRLRHDEAVRSWIEHGRPVPVPAS